MFYLYYYALLLKALKSPYQHLPWLGTHCGGWTTACHEYSPALNKSRNCFFIAGNYAVSGNLLTQGDTTYTESAVYRNRRFRLSYQQVSYDEATRRCINDNAKLVVIDSDNVSTVITSMLQTSGIMARNYVNPAHVEHGVWFGLVLDLADKSIGIWSDGSKYSRENK